jgi:peptidoglycan/xylan/chitin deacetylase (PgdA/CDA1 family)
LTPALVELLHRFGAKATFFLVGFRSLRFPAMCDLIQRDGHQLGCHTSMHRRPWRVMPWQTASDVTQGYRQMANWLRPRASFRPPFGKLTTWSWLAARRHQAPLSFWTHDGCDTHESLPDPAKVAKQAVDAGGAVVLMHSHDRGSDRQRYVLSLTEHLLLAARQRGLKVCTMQELQDSGSIDSSGGFR